MGIYLYSMALSLVGILIVNKFNHDKKDKGYFSLSLISLLPTTIVAGTRDFIIGTDIQHYIVTNFNAALNYNKLFDYVLFIQNTKTSFVGTVNHTEIGYSVLVYLISRITNDAHWLLFSLQALTVILVYFGIINFYKKLKISIPFALFIYYTIFYGPSLNIMRQSLAMAIGFYSFSLLLNGYEKRAVAILFVAISFHLSALVWFFISIIWYLSKTEKIKNYFSIMSFVIGVVIFGIIQIFGSNLFDLFASIIGIIPFLSRYKPSFATTGGYTFLRVLVVIFPDLLILALNTIVNPENKENKIYRFFTYMMLISITLFSMYSLQSVIPRLGIYFSVFGIVSWSYYINRIKSIPLKISFYSGMVTVLIAIFIVTTISGSGEIYPYSSEILNIF